MIINFSGNINKYDIVKVRLQSTIGKSSRLLSGARLYDFEFYKLKTATVPASRFGYIFLQFFMFLTHPMNKFSYICYQFWYLVDWTFMRKDNLIDRRSNK